MNKIPKIILISGFAILAISVLPISSVSAVSPFTVNFEQTPLFSEANFLPGQDVVKWVDVTNNTSDTEVIGVEATSYTSCSGTCFADQLNLVIRDGATDLYESSLADFFTAGQKKLSDIAPGGTTKYYFTITFLPNAGNQYQSNEVGFDFDIGIFGQETIGSADCGNGVCDSDENCSICPSDCGTCGGGVVPPGGGGGTFGGSTGLIIFDEASSPVVSGQTYITWKTNHPATSRVIYSSQHEAHSFDLNNPPNYGYAHSNVEDPSPVINHSMNISGLTPGVTYYYRVASRGSFAVSIEHSFTAPGIMAAETGPVEENTGSTIALNQGTGGEENIENTGDGVVAGESTGGEDVAQEAQSQGNSANPFLASLLDLFRGGINLCLVIFLFIVAITVLLLLSLEMERKGEDKTKRWIFAIAIIAILIILYGLVCPYYITLLVVVGILFVLFLLYYRLKSKKL